MCRLQVGLMSYLDIVCETSYGKESVTNTGRLYIIFITVLYSKQKKDDIEWWNRRLRLLLWVVERDYDGKKRRRKDATVYYYNNPNIQQHINNHMILIRWHVVCLQGIVDIFIAHMMNLYRFLIFYTNIGNWHGYLSPYGVYAIIKIDNLFYDENRRKL